MTKTGIVAIGMWNDHWCTAYKAWIDELALRLNDWVAKARERGAQIFFVMEPPSGKEAYLPNTVPLRSRPCACGPAGTCIYCETGACLHPTLDAMDVDWVLCHDTVGMVGKGLGIKRLLYVGAGVGHEVLFHPSGAVAMRKRYDVVLVRDMLLSLHVHPSIPLSHALSRYQIPSVVSKDAL